MARRSSVWDQIAHDRELRRRQNERALRVQRQVERGLVADTSRARTVSEREAKARERERIEGEHLAGLAQADEQNARLSARIDELSSMLRTNSIVGRRAERSAATVRTRTLMPSTPRTSGAGISNTRLAATSSVIRKLLSCNFWDVAPVPGSMPRFEPVSRCRSWNGFEPTLVPRARIRAGSRLSR